MNISIHQLKEYIEMLTELDLVSETVASDEQLALPVQHISYNSKDIKDGTLFVCKGAHFDPKYLDEAASNGAFCYVSEQKYDSKLPCILVKNIREALCRVAVLFYGHEEEDLNLVAITGTKGKSTTTYFLKFIIDDFMEDMKKKPCGYVSTIDTFDGKEIFKSHITTPDNFEVHKHFRNMLESGIEYCVMEASSQALKYDRLLGIRYDVGAFMNIGEDHISDIEHKDFEDYFNSKLRIFDLCDTAVVNMESDHAEEILARAMSACEKVITFGYDESYDIYAKDIKSGDKYTLFTVVSDSFEEEVKLGLRGLFNVDNALCAIAICYALNIPLKYILSGLKRASVPGRMEMFTDGKVHVVIDYAHNKMSFDALFDSVKKEFPGEKISIVFGCPGCHAYNRRTELGHIAGKLADKIYLTEDDPERENVLDICKEIFEHIKEVGGEAKTVIIEDRPKAIEKAIEEAKDGGVILCVAKGRDEYEKRGDGVEKVESDVHVVERLLHLKK